MCSNEYSLSVEVLRTSTLLTGPRINFKSLRLIESSLLTGVALMSCFGCLGLMFSRVENRKFSLYYSSFSMQRGKKRDVCFGSSTDLRFIWLCGEVFQN